MNSTAADIAGFTNPAINNTTILGEPYIIIVMLTIITLFLVSRRFQRWGVLVLPILMGWKVSGVDIPVSFLIISGLLFVLSALGTQTITSAVTIVGDGFKGIMDNSKYTQRQKDNQDYINMKRQKFLEKKIAEHEKLGDQQRKMKAYNELRRLGVDLTGQPKARIKYAVAGGKAPIASISPKDNAENLDIISTGFDGYINRIKNEYQSKPKLEYKRKKKQ